MFGIKKRLKELERRIYLLEKPYKYKAGDKAHYLEDHMGESTECLIVESYQRYDGFKRYKVFIDNMLIYNVCEYFLFKDVVKKKPTPPDNTSSSV